MMSLGNLRREEQVGLVLAVALHAGLLSLFLLHRSITPAPVPQPIDVTLSPDTGLNAAAPTHADAAADIAPTLGAPPPAPAPRPAASPPSASVAAPPLAKTVSEPTPVTVAEPRRTEMPKPKPEVVKTPVPAAEATPVTPPRHRARIPAATTSAAVPDKPVPAKPVTTKPAHEQGTSVKDWNLAAPATAQHQPAGGSRIGNDFLKGIAGGKASGKAPTQGAAVIGPEVASGLSGAIAHQLKPHWEAPQGVDADRLVTVLSWDLNADGSLVGTPRVVRQEGITDSNRPQAARHAEQAIRAVELGAPFKLPAQYYAQWKHVRSFEFNRTLSQ